MEVEALEEAGCKHIQANDPVIVFNKNDYAMFAKAIGALFGPAQVAARFAIRSQIAMAVHPGDSISALTQTRDGAVWVGTAGGGLVRWKNV